LFLLHFLLLEQSIRRLNKREQQGSSKQYGVNKEGIKTKQSSDLQHTFLPFFGVTFHTYICTDQQPLFFILKYFSLYILNKLKLAFRQICMKFSPFIANSFRNTKIQGGV
jgi:hypothetical protein